MRKIKSIGPAPLSRIVGTRINIEQLVNNRPKYLTPGRVLEVKALEMSLTVLSKKQNNKIEWFRHSAHPIFYGKNIKGSLPIKPLYFAASPAKILNFTKIESIF